MQESCFQIIKLGFVFKNVLWILDHMGHSVTTQLIIVFTDAQLIPMEIIKH